MMTINSRKLLVPTLAMCMVAGSAWAQNTAPSQPTKVEPAKKPEIKKPEQPAGQPDMQALMEAAAKVGPNHKLLEAFVGEWEGTVKMWMDPTQTPTESATSCTHKMEMDGRYLFSHYTGDFMGQKFKGIGIMGYNNTTKEFESAWIDSMGTGVESSTGSVTPDGKTFTFSGGMTDPTAGKKVKTRETMKWVSADTYSQEFFNTGPDGKEVKSMEITLHRKGTATKAVDDAKKEIKKELKDGIKKIEVPGKK